MRDVPEGGCGSNSSGQMMRFTLTLQTTLKEVWTGDIKNWLPRIALPQTNFQQHTAGGGTVAYRQMLVIHYK